MRVGTVSAVSASTAVPSIVDDLDPSATAMPVDVYLPANGPKVTDRVVYEVVQGLVIVHANISRTPIPVAARALASLASGWAAVGAGAWAQVVGGTVLIWGSLQNAAFTNTSFTTVAQLPAGVPPPPIASGSVVSAIGGNTAATRAVQVLNTGAVQIRSDAATASFYNLNLSYPAI